MGSERFWIAVLALTSFLAGLAGGVLLGARRNPPDEGPFTSYKARLTEEYALSEFDQDRLAQILAAYVEEIDRLRDRQLRDSDADLVRAGRDCAQRIARYVIPEDGRDAFRTQCDLRLP